jgi:hypothetical protein
MQFTVTIPSVSTIVKRVPSGIAHLTQYALPATIALGFFVSWIAFGAYTLLLLLPFLVAQKPDFNKPSPSRKHGVSLIFAGAVVAIAATQFVPADHLQGFMQSLAKLRSVRSPLAESVAAGNVSDITVFTGEAFSGVAISLIAFYHLVYRNEFYDLCSMDLRSQVKRTSWGWTKWCFAWAMMAFVMFWINISASNEGIVGWLLVAKAVMMPAICWVFLNSAVAAIRALPLMIPDVDAKPTR